MTHDRPTEEITERAALFSLGAMAEEESVTFSRHLEEDGCVVCRAEVEAFGGVCDALAEAVPPADPPVSLYTRLLDRLRGDARSFPSETQIWKNWREDQTLGPRFLKRNEDGDWKPTRAEGVYARQLYMDRQADRVTMLIRMDPGSSYPPHRHAGVEECYVLSGDLHVDDIIMRAGDYQRLETGQLHGVQSTEEGCLLFIVSSLQDEILV